MTQTNTTQADNQRLADAIFGKNSPEAKSMKQAGERTQPKPWKSDVRLALEQELELVTQQRDELLAACKAAQKFIKKLETLNAVEPNSNSGLDWDTRFVLQAAIAKAEGRAQ